MLMGAAVDLQRYDTWCKEVDARNSGVEMVFLSRIFSQIKRGEGSKHGK